MSNYIKNGVFNHQKWQRETLLEGPGNDPMLKSLRTRIPGEKFPDLNTWWEYEPEDIMTYVYWHQGQLPPTGPQFDKEWTNIVKQLHSKHPIPADVLPSVDLDRDAMDAIMHDVPRAENIDRATMTEAETNIAGQTKQFRPGDMWSNDFDYIGMLRYGAEYKIPEPMYIREKPTMYALNQLYNSFTDVNYHTEAADLGNAIEWLEDAKGTEDVEKAIDFLEMWKEACAKTLKEIERR